MKYLLKEYIGRKGGDRFRAQGCRFEPSHTCLKNTTLQPLDGLSGLTFLPEDVVIPIVPGSPATQSKTHQKKGKLRKHNKDPGGHLPGISECHVWQYEAFRYLLFFVTLLISIFVSSKSYLKNKFWSQFIKYLMAKKFKNQAIKWLLDVVTHMNTAHKHAGIFGLGSVVASEGGQLLGPLISTSSFNVVLGRWGQNCFPGGQAPFSGYRSLQGLASSLGSIWGGSEFGFSSFLSCPFIYLLHI